MVSVHINPADSKRSKSPVRAGGRAAAFTLIVVFAAVCVSHASACTDTAVGPADAGARADAEAGIVRVTICPVNVPENGADCIQPDGTTCKLGPCDELIGACERGKWRIAKVFDDPYRCPLTEPKPAAACTKCWPANQACEYTCSAALGRVASCKRAPDGTWLWTVLDQACAPSDAGLDADGAADADAGGDTGGDR
jgi:hypothetical protein